MVVYERGATNWSAFVPDLLGCGSLGENLEDTRANVREAIELYLSESGQGRRSNSRSCHYEGRFQRVRSRSRSKAVFCRVASRLAPAIQHRNTSRLRKRWQT